MWDDPISENGWALGAALILGLATFGPVAFMMGRSVFGRRKQGTKMDQTDDTQVGLADAARAEEEAASHAGEDGQGDVQPMRAVPAGRPDAEIDAATEERWAAEGIPLPADTVVFDQGGHWPAAPGRTVGAAQVPAPLISMARVECEHCKGVGYMPGINDLLNESVALLGDRGDEVIRLFYAKLLGAAPQLAGLFPPDLVSANPGAIGSSGLAQREKLLGAIAALADLYDPSVPGKMDRLTSALERFGRSHAAFVRPDGTISGASLEEYAAVKEALFTTLIRFAAEKWKAEYTAAWSQAYDYAAAVMMAEQIRSGFSAPRFPRA